MYIALIIAGIALVYLAAPRGYSRGGYDIVTYEKPIWLIVGMLLIAGGIISWISQYS